MHILHKWSSWFWITGTMTEKRKCFKCPAERIRMVSTHRY